MRGALRWFMGGGVLVLGLLIASDATAAQVTNTFTNFGGDGIGVIQFNADQGGVKVRWSYAPFSTGTEPSVTERTSQLVAGDPSGNRYEVLFNDTSGRVEPGNDFYYRIDTAPVSRLTISGPKNTDRNPPGDIRNFTVASRTSSSVTLTWTVPGNDGTFNGQDFGGVPIVHLGYRAGSGAWSSAADCDGTPEPSYSASGFPNVGQTATVTVSGLQPGTTYVFCAIAKDTVNRSAGFTSTTATTDAPPPDTQAPTTPSSLTFTDLTRDGARILWTAPSDNVAVTRYDIRYRIGQSITEADWTSAAAVSSPPSPGASGVPQSHTLTGLTADTNYAVGLKACDAAGNCSPIVSVPFRTIGTSSGGGGSGTSGDTQAPGVPTNLVVEEATSTFGRIAWTAPSDNVGVTRFDVRYRSNAATPLAEADWSSATVLSVSVAAIPGSRHSFSIGSLTADTAYAAGVKACDASGNCSSIASVTFRTLPAPPGGCASWIPGTRPMAINDFHAVPGPGAQVVWTVPAGVEQYEARFSPNPIMESNLGIFLGMSPNPPTTLCGGLTTIITLSGIPPATTGYVVIRAINRAGATLSNPITTPIGGGPSGDTQAPNSIGTLVATGVTASAAVLTWIAPSDNIAVTRYEIRSRPGSTSPFTEPEWNSATPVTGTPAPAAPLTPQSHTLGSLTADTPYAVGLKACDAAGNCSAIASATFRTATSGATGGTSGGPDTQPPGIPTALAAEETTGAYTRITWIEPADNVAVTSYNVRYRQGTSFVEADWANALPMPAVTSTVSAGDRVSTALPGLTANTDYTVGVKACDAAGNCSAIATVTFRHQSSTGGTGTGTISSGTSAIVGIVRRQDGVTPAVGVPVGLRVNDTAARRDTTTGPDGRYAFSAIAAGTYRVELGWGISTPTEYSWPYPISTTVPTGQTVTVDFTLSPPRTTGGTGGTSGSGVAACAAWVSGTRPGAITDLHIMSSGPAPELMWLIPPGVARYEIRYSTTGFSESTVDASTAIGTFTSAPPMGPCGTSTPSIGVSGLAVGTTYYVAVRAVNNAGSALSNLIRITPSTSGGTTGGGTTPPSSEAGNLRVSVRDATGAVLVGATVEIRLPSTGASIRMTTDTTGLAFFATLAPGSYTVEVVPPSHRTDLGRIGTLGVPVVVGTTSDHTTTLPVQGIVPPSPSTTSTPASTTTPTGGSVGMGSICGTVSDADRHPLPGVTVGLQRRSNAAYGIGLTTTTDASGRYCFPDLAPGEYGIGALIPSHRTDLAGVGPGTIVVIPGAQAVHDVAFGRASPTGIVPVITPSPGPVAVPGVPPPTPPSVTPPPFTPPPLPALEQCIRTAFGEDRYQRMKSGRDKPSAGEYERVRHCFNLAVIVDHRPPPTIGVPPTPTRPIVIIAPPPTIAPPPVRTPEFDETCEQRELPRVRQGLQNLGRELGRIEREADALRRRKVEVPIDFGIVLGRAKDLLQKVQGATTCEDAFDVGSEIPDLMEQLRTSLDRISRLRFAPKALTAYDRAVRQFTSRVTSGLRRIERSGIEVADLRDRLTTTQKELTECRTSATDALRAVDPELFEESMRTCAELLDEHRELEEHVQALADVRGFLVGRVNATLQRANRLILDLRRQRRDVAEIQRFARELRTVRDEVLKKVRANQIDRDALVDALLPVVDAFGNLDDVFEQARGTSTYDELVGPRTPAVRAPTLQRPVEEFFRSGGEER